MLEKLKKIFKLNYFLALILGLASVIRFWRINELLGFWYDQGRDALIVWDLIHKGKFFLIGPTTGLAGVFRGPWYYWLISPFYFMGGGNPVWPSVFLILTTVLAIYIIYTISKKWFGVYTAILFAFISSFSYYFITSARWLSNPTPMFLISALYLLGFSKIIEKKNWGWYLVALMSGMAMQFGSASEVFYIPGAIIFAILYRKHFPSIKTILISALFFIIPFLPQLLFDARHGWIIFGAIYKNFFGGTAVARVIWKDFLPQRLNLYYDIFSSKLFFGKTIYAVPFLATGLLGLITNWKKTIRNPGFGAVLIMVLAPFFGLIFFRGNYGNLYDYYFTGFYLPVILLFSILLSSIKWSLIRNLIVGFFVISFLYFNLPMIKNYLSTGADSDSMVFLGNQQDVIDWIYKDAKGEPFNVDVYVPPVIPYAYTYLFEWYGPLKFGYAPLEKNIPLLYTIEEADPDHPDRIEAWYARQKGIAKIEETKKFGILTVERRTRINGK